MSPQDWLNQCRHLLIFLGAVKKFQRLNKPFRRTANLQPAFYWTYLTAPHSSSCY
jgi:hypothetical protein